MTQTKNEKIIWGINVPGEEARSLYEQATKILTNRNLIKPARTRKPKENKSA